jgi:hypothetical protein
MNFNAVSLVMLSSLIQSVITIFIQDKFTKCYNTHANSALYYRELMTASTAMCALDCLPDAACAGFDICPIGDNPKHGNNLICRLRDSSDIETCVAHDNYGLEPRCGSFLRVSKHTYYGYVIITITI